MKILAVDIGSAQIKSAVFEAKFNRFDIIRHDIVEVPGALESLAPGAPVTQSLTPGQATALAKVWTETGGSVDRVVTNIPYNLYACRLLTFPFSDRKKINAAAPFQIEDEVPFDLEKCIVSNQIFPNPGGTETQALVSVAQISDLQNFVTSLVNATAIDPDVLTTTQSSTYAFLERSNQVFGGKAIAIINLGHRASSINIYKDCVPVLNRTSMVGGLNLTEAIAKQYNIGLAEAELAKLQSGFLAPPGIDQTNEQRAFSDLISLVLEPVFHDFYQALMAYFSRYRERVTQIYVTGGTALLPGTCDYLAARWQLPVHPLKVTSLLPNISIHPTASTDLVLSQAVFLGLSQVEGRSKETQNFRIGALRRQGAGFNINLKAIEQPLKVFAAVYLFALLAMGLQYFLLKNQVAKKDIRRDAAIRRVFGAGIKAAQLYQLKNNPEKIRRDAKAKVDDLRGQLAGAAEDPAFSPLSVLKEMSQAIPSSTAVKLQKLDMTPQSMRVRLEADSPANIDKAVAALKSLKAAATASEPVRETLPNQKQAASLEVKLKPGVVRN